MEQIRWFDRKFDFNKSENTFPSIVERLNDTPLRIRHRTQALTNQQLIYRPENKWSIQENIGHLLDLEILWSGRLTDILEGKKYLREADLENNQTHNAHHNSKELGSIIEQFKEERQTLVRALRALNYNDVRKSALHPRLKTPMTIIDLFYFVAEHDDHHIAQIQWILSQADNY